MWSLIILKFRWTASCTMECDSVHLQVKPFEFEMLVKIIFESGVVQNVLDVYN